MYNYVLVIHRFIENLNTIITIAVVVVTIVIAVLLHIIIVI